jgi:hypothetical protein
MEFNQNMEVFRAIDGFLNYEVSNHGRVRNANTGRILKTDSKRNGYKYVNLSKNNKQKKFNIHRLVAEAFVENPDNFNTVDHISKNKLDNSANNLRWATSSMQQRNKGLQKNNSSYSKGVFHDQVNKAWKASIYNNDNVRISKTFSINKYSNAKELAKAWRRQKEIEFDYTPV